MSCFDWLFREPRVFLLSCGCYFCPDGLVFYSCSKSGITPSSFYSRPRRFIPLDGPH